MLSTVILCNLFKKFLLLSVSFSCNSAVNYTGTSYSLRQAWYGCQQG